MNKQLYYVSVSENLAILKTMGVPFPDGDYFCPVCKKGFSEVEVYNELTEEDVPQASLGGSRITLTCRNCNSKCGSEIDIHLLNAIKDIEQKSFLPGTDRMVELKDGDKVIRANLIVHNRNELTLNINTKYNNPKFWNYYHDKILLPDKIIDIADKPLKKDERRISSAILKNAYLLLFAKTGYTFLFDSYYDSLREQIRNPEQYILPERLWTFQNLNVADGIYLSCDNRNRGFFVIYSLRLKQSYKVCVLIPTPKVEYLVACMRLREYGPDTPLSIKAIPEFNYLQDEDAISRLRNWCYGWNMNL